MRSVQDALRLAGCEAGSYVFEDDTANIVPGRDVVSILDVAAGPALLDSSPDKTSFAALQRFIKAASGGGCGVFWCGRLCGASLD